MYKAFNEKLVKIYDETFPSLVRQTTLVDLQKPYMQK